MLLYYVKSYEIAIIIFKQWQFHMAEPTRFSI